MFAGTLIAQLDDEESDDDIAEPSSVFSNHSVGSRSSPGHREPARNTQMFSPEYTATSDTKNRNERKNHAAKSARSKKKSENLSGSAEYLAERRSEQLVHSESKGFNIDRVRSSDPLTHSGRPSGGINIGDEAPVSMLESPNGEDLTELVALQRQLNTTKDPAILFKIVMLIQQVGKFKIGESTFDFDLCTLDSSTVQQIRTYLSQ